MSDGENDRNAGIDRRGALECMIWAGTGVLWTLSGGVPRSLGLLGAAQAAETSASAFSFLQISDSHVGFDKPANTDVTATLREAIAKIKAEPEPPAASATRTLESRSPRLRRCPAHGSRTTKPHHPRVPATRRGRNASGEGRDGSGAME